MLKKKQNDSKSWLQGLIHCESILKSFMTKHDNNPSIEDMSQKLQAVFCNHCNSFSQQVDFDNGVMDYINNYIDEKYKSVLKKQEPYIP